MLSHNTILLLANTFGAYYVTFYTEGILRELNGFSYVGTMQISLKLYFENLYKLSNSNFKEKIYVGMCV